jgi:hypothetical protein
MDKRLARIIVAAAPKVFLAGFEPQVGDGWFSLILDMSRRLKAACERQEAEGQVPILIIRMKERFGGLRIAGVGVSGEADLIIRGTEARSLTICERCGEPGVLRRDHGYHRTFCDQHDQDFLRSEGFEAEPPKADGARGIQVSETRLWEWAVEEGFGPFERVLCQARVLPAGWAMDSQAWVVAMPDGSVIGFTTNHGNLVVWTLEDAKEKLEETLTSARAIQTALGFLAKPP